jgi:hypothetical protein
MDSWLIKQSKGLKVISIYWAQPVGGSPAKKEKGGKELSNRLPDIGSTYQLINRGEHA